MAHAGHQPIMPVIANMTPLAATAISVTPLRLLHLIRKFKNSDELNEEIIDPELLTDEKISQLQLEQKISGFISNLDPIYREIILLRDIEGLSAPETAAKLGKTIEAVKSRLHRARNDIRSQLARFL